jgi:hypothetical protein
MYPRQTKDLSCYSTVGHLEHSSSNDDYLLPSFRSHQDIQVLTHPSMELVNYEELHGMELIRLTLKAELRTVDGVPGLVGATSSGWIAVVIATRTHPI